MRKSPLLAAVLNFFFFGAGTLYVGRRMVAGLLLTAGGTAAQIAEIRISPAFENAAPGTWPYLLGGLILLKLGLAYDGWSEARSVAG